MDINYQQQLKLKTNLIKNAIKKTCKIDLDEIEIIPSRQLNYRNKIRLQVDENGNLAYNKKASNDLVAIEDCLLANEHIRKNLPQIQKISQDINKKYGKIIKEISIRSNGEKILLNIYTKDEKNLYNYLKDKNKDFNINLTNKKSTLTIGDDYLIHRVKDKKFKISKDDFFQVNDSQIENLYSEASQYLEKDKKLLDLFCGSGISSMALANDHIVGIEINKSAIKDAIENAEANGLKDYKFIAKTPTT